MLHVLGLFIMSIVVQVCRNCFMEMQTWAGQAKTPYKEALPGPPFFS